eukprot:14465427-Alexandrium_andersonii.AAC.1
MLDDTSRRWRLSYFTNVRRRAILGNVDGSAPWGNPDPAGTNYVWARSVEVCAQTGGDIPLTW